MSILSITKEMIDNRTKDQAPLANIINDEKEIIIIRQLSVTRKIWKIAHSKPEENGRTCQ